MGDRSLHDSVVAFENAFSFKFFLDADILEYKDDLALASEEVLLHFHVVVAVVNWFSLILVNVWQSLSSRWTRR